MTPRGRNSCARSSRSTCSPASFMSPTPITAPISISPRSGISVETRAKTSDSGAGVDVAVAQSVEEPERNHPRAAAERRGRARQGDLQHRRRRRRRGDFGIARARDRRFVEICRRPCRRRRRPSESRPRLRATLPLWNDLKTNGEIHDLTLQTPMADATLKTIGETIGLSGFIADGAARNRGQDRRADVQFAAAAALGREAVAGLAQFRSQRRRQRPRSRSPNSRSTIRISAARASCRRETQDKIDAVLLAGQPKLTLAPGRFTTPTLDLTFEGEASIETGAPSGHFTFTADGLDKTIALLAGDRQERAGFAAGRARPHLRSRAWRRPGPTGGWCGRST